MNQPAPVIAEAEGSTAQAEAKSPPRRPRPPADEIFADRTHLGSWGMLAASFFLRTVDGLELAAPMFGMAFAVPSVWFHLIGRESMNTPVSFVALLANCAVFYWILVDLSVSGAKIALLVGGVLFSALFLAIVGVVLVRALILFSVPKSSPEQHADMAK